MSAAKARQDGKDVGPELRAHVRKRRSEDPSEILAGRIASRAEWEAWRSFEARMTWKQWIISQQIFFMINLRNSFIHGSIRRGLTVMAVYAAGAEFLHDFFHDYHYVHTFLNLFGTSHAVGFIALSHLSEHTKEWLEEKDKPRYHAKERERLEILRIFAGERKLHWPRHIQWYHEFWSKHRGDLGCFIDANAQREVREADEK